MTVSDFLPNMPFDEKEKKKKRKKEQKTKEKKREKREEMRIIYIFVNQSQYEL